MTSFLLKALALVIFLLGIAGSAPSFLFGPEDNVNPINFTVIVMVPTLIVSGLLYRLANYLKARNHRAVS